MSLLYASRLVCPRCGCGLAEQIRPDLIVCPCCGHKFTFKEVMEKNDKKKEKIVWAFKRAQRCNSHKPED